MLLKRGFRLLAVMTMTLALATTGFAWPPGGNGGGGNGGGGNGGGGNGGGEDPPPPVLFELQRYPMPGGYAGGTVSPQEMNIFGELVGYYYLPNGPAQPLYIDVNSGAGAVNLNDLTLDPNYDLPDGWYFYVATGINNWSEIIGALASDPSGDQLRGFVLEMIPDPTDSNALPRLHLIPDDAWSRTYPRRINDSGEILGRGDSITSYVYRPGLRGLPADVDVEVLPFAFDAWSAHLNNATASHDAEIVGYASAIGEYFHYTLGDASPSIINLDISSISGFSDSGSFCGSRNVRKNRQVGYLYDGALTDVPGGASGLNDSGDVVGNATGDVVLNHAESGSLNLRTLGVAANSFDQELWDSGLTILDRVTERNVIGTDPTVADFPAVFGALRRYDTEWTFHYEVYVLLPIPVP